MRRLCTVSIFVCLVQCVDAGGFSGGHYSTSITEKKFSFGFKFGIALPVADFGNKSGISSKDTLHEHGYANPGFEFEIGATYRFAKNIGVAVSMFNTLCKFDVASYTSANPDMLFPNSSVSVSGKHFVAQYLFGPYFFFPLSDNFALDAKTLVGILSSRYPDFTIASTIPGNLSAKTISHAQASGFGYTFSFGGEYKIGDYIAITAAATYSGSNVSYSGIFYTISTPSGLGYTLTSSSTRTMALGIIGFTAGFSVIF